MDRGCEGGSGVRREGERRLYLESYKFVGGEPEPTNLITFVGFYWTDELIHRKFVG